MVLAHSVFSATNVQTRQLPARTQRSLTLKCGVLRRYVKWFRMLLGLPRYCSACRMFADACVDDSLRNQNKRVTDILPAGAHQWYPNHITHNRMNSFVFRMFTILHVLSNFRKLQFNTNFILFYRYRQTSCTVTLNAQKSISGIFDGEDRGATTGEFRMVCLEACLATPLQGIIIYCTCTMRNAINKYKTYNNL